MCILFSSLRERSVVEAPRAPIQHPDVLRHGLEQPVPERPIRQVQAHVTQQFSEKHSNTFRFGSFEGEHMPIIIEDHILRQVLYFRNVARVSTTGLAPVPFLDVLHECRH